MNTHLDQISSSVGLDLLQALLAEVRLLQRPWPALSQAQQDEIIDRLRRRVAEAVRQAVLTIAAADRVMVAGELEQIQIKEGVKAVVRIPTGAPSLHDLYDAAGKVVLLVVTNAKRHTEGMEDVRGQPDQQTIEYLEAPK